MPLPTLASIGSFLGGLGSIASAGTSLASLIGLGNDGRRIRREDFDHHQNLADVGNPREIRRQSQFLEGIAPAQANAYNTYQDATYAEDTRREIERQNAMNPVQAANDLAYMDTVYAGTSAWERLGSNAAPSISAPAPSQGAPRSGSPSEGMAPLTPLIQTQMAADNQKEIAFLNNLTSLQQTRIQTNNGELPSQQTLKAAADTVQTEAQTLLTQAQTENVNADTHLKGTQAANTFEQARFTRISGLVTAFTGMLKMLPTEEVDLVMYKLTSQPGMEQLAKALAAELNPPADGASRGYGLGTTTESRLADAINKLDFDAQNKFIKDAAQIAAILGGGAKAGAGFLSNLGKLKPKITSTEKYSRVKGGWKEEITNTRQQ